MKVILSQDNKKLGKKGDIIEVSEGYARNYLLPHNIAIEATKTNLNVAKAKQGSIARQKQQDKDEAVLMAAQLKKVEITIPVRTGEDGRLFGSVTSRDVVEKLHKDFNIELDKRKVEIASEIKHTGTFDVLVKVYPGITSTIKLHIVSAE